jgi:hypothetical protein
MHVFWDLEKYLIFEVRNAALAAHPFWHINNGSHQGFVKTFFNSVE